MMNLRERYRKFKAWQKEPLHYVNMSTGTENRRKRPSTNH